MKNYLKAALISLFVLVFFTSCDEQGFSIKKSANKLIDKSSSNNEKPSTLEQKSGYAIGYQFAQNLMQNTMDGSLDINSFSQAVKTAYAKKPPLMTEEEMRTTIQTFHQQQRQAVMEKRKTEGAGNKTKATKFLAENAKKPNIVTLPSGLQYQVITKGSDAKPTIDDKVSVHYKGTLIDGTEFDSSYKRGQPTSFALKGVIKGWTEGIQLMSKGAKWKLFIPPELAYGERGAGAIPPNSALIFEVELLDIIAK